MGNFGPFQLASGSPEKTLPSSLTGLTPVPCTFTRTIWKNRSKSVLGKILSHPLLTTITSLECIIRLIPNRNCSFLETCHPNPDLAQNEAPSPTAEESCRWNRRKKPGRSAGLLIFDEDLAAALRDLCICIYVNICIYIYTYVYMTR